MSDNILRREHSLYNDSIEYRAVEEDGKHYIEGYAAVFNKRSKLLYERGKYFYEELERGAFSDVLNDPNLDVYFVRNHNRDLVIARLRNGSLSLKEDETGLFFRAEINFNVSYAKDTWENVRSGILFDNSFAFSVLPEGYREEQIDSKISLVKVSKVSRLIDVSTVTNGAYSDTSVLARELPEYDTNEEEKEERKETDNELYKTLHKLRENEINI